MLIESPAPHRPPGSAVRIGIWGVLLLALTVLALSRYDSFQLGAWNDDATYVAIARALLTPELRAWLAAHPVLAAFPPGYPLILAPLVALSPGNFLILKLSSLAATLLCATLLYWGWGWFAPALSYRWTVAVTGLFAVSYLTIEHTRMVMSEPAFALLSLLALLLAEQAVRRGARPGPDLLLGALLAFSVLVRSVGLILVATVVAYLVIRGGRRCWATVGATAAGAAVALALVVWLTPVSVRDIVPGRYLKNWDAAIAHSPAAALDPPESAQVTRRDRVRGLFEDYIVGGIVQRFGTDLDSLVLPVGGGANEMKLAESVGLPWLPRASGYLVSGLVWIGVVAFFIRKRATAFLVFAPAYLVLTFIWESSGTRLFYPVLPQLLLAFLLGVDTAVRGLIALVRAPALAKARLPLMILFVIFLTLASVRKSLRRPDTRLHIGDLEARSSWIVVNTDSSATVMSETPAIELAYTNRKTIDYPPGCLSPEALMTYLSTEQVDFVLVAPDTSWQEQYVPALSRPARCVLDALAALQTEGHAERAFASEDGHIQVLRIAHE